MQTNILLVNEYCICHSAAPIARGGMGEGPHIEPWLRGPAEHLPPAPPREPGARTGPPPPWPGLPCSPSRCSPVMAAPGPQHLHRDKSSLRLHEPPQPCPAHPKPPKPSLLRAAHWGLKRPKPPPGEMRLRADYKQHPRGCPLWCYQQQQSQIPHLHPGWEGGTFLCTLLFLSHKQTIHLLFRACQFI